MSATTQAQPRIRRTVMPRSGSRQRATNLPVTPAAEATGTRRVNSLPFLALVAALLGFGLIALLMVNNSLAAGSFEQARLRAEQVHLFELEQVSRQSAERLSSPTRLRAEARTLGLIPAATTAYLDLESGRILGTPLPAGQAAANGTGATSGTAPELVDGIAAETSPDPATGQLGGDSAATDNTQTPGEVPEGVEGVEGSDGAAVTPPGSTAYDRAVVSGGSDQ